MQRRAHPGTWIAITLVLASCTGLEPQPGEQAADPGSATFELRDLDSEEAAFLDIINEYRETHGLGPLVASRSINQAAYDHSLDMGTQNYFEHESLDGRSPWDRMCDAGHEPACSGGAYLGENIAAGNSDAWSTFVQWRESPPHNENMLTPEFTCIGIGRAYVETSTYRWYWTTDFSSVIDHPVGCQCEAGETQPCENEGCEGTQGCDGCYWEECDAPAPTAEVCDDVDNDCDDLIDEDDVCGTPCEPEEEVCDGADNDCDGAIDEDDVCGEGCEPDGDEVCDGVDNDCDGVIDPGCTCPGAEGATRPCGTNVGICEFGTQTCVVGYWTDCEGGIDPEPWEDCSDGLDNDCNGLIDEADPGCGAIEGGCACSLAGAGEKGGGAAALAAGLLVLVGLALASRRRG